MAAKAILDVIDIPNRQRSQVPAEILSDHDLDNVNKSVI